MQEPAIEKPSSTADPEFKAIQRVAALAAVRPVLRDLGLPIKGIHMTNRYGYANFRIWNPCP
jgi:hypothetical protein